MDIGVTIGKVRKEYKEYLRENHPDWADTTVSTHVSDAFYLYQTPSHFLFGSALKVMPLWKRQRAKSMTT